MPKLIHEWLRELREDRGWTTATLSGMTANPKEGNPGIGEKTIQAIEKSPGRIPEARVLQALADALKMDASEFYEWPIAIARRESAASPESARRREADALRKKAQRQRERQQDAPDTTPAPRRRRGEGR